MQHHVDALAHSLSFSFCTPFPIFLCRCLEEEMVVTTREREQNHYVLLKRKISYHYWQIDVDRFVDALSEPFVSVVIAHECLNLK